MIELRAFGYFEAEAKGKDNTKGETAPVRCGEGGKAGGRVKLGEVVKEAAEGGDAGYKPSRSGQQRIGR